MARTKKDEQSQSVNPQEQGGMVIEPDAQSPEQQFEAAQDAKRLQKRHIIFYVVLAVACCLAVAALLVIRNNNLSKNPTKNTNTQATVVAPAEVSITSGELMPATVKIKVGQSVVWKNNDTIDHQIAADPYPTNTSLPDLGKGEVLKPGDSFAYQFEKSGTYTYHDNLNPYAIKGMVVVQ
jgi:plastocyanin